MTRDDPNVPSFEPDHEGPDLLYVQLADYLQARIEQGDLRRGQRLAPERELAEEYGVGYMTVRRGMRELRERGLIRSVHGRGTFVSPRE